MFANKDFQPTFRGEKFIPGRIIKWTIISHYYRVMDGSPGQVDVSIIIILFSLVKKLPKHKHLYYSEHKAG